MDIQVKTTKPQMGIEPLVDVHVEIINIIVKDTNVQNVAKYIHFILYHFPRISGTESKVHRG